MNMPRLALLYMTSEGQTKKVMKQIAYCLEQAGHTVVISDIRHLPDGFTLTQFDGAVLGCSVRYGKHHAFFRHFLKKHQSELSQIPGFFYSINLTARKRDRSEPHNNQYLQKFLNQTDWQPELVEVFAGALLYTRYNLVDRFMIQLIMKMTGGPTDPSQDTEFTDWKKVNNFAKTVGQTMYRL